MIKGIFFDTNGVLFQGDNLKLAAKEYEKKFNAPAGKVYEAVHNFQGWKDFTLGKVTEEEYISQCQGRMSSFKGKYFLKILKTKIIPNQEMLDYAKELSKNYLIGIISNSPKEWFENLVNKAKLRKFVKVEAVSGHLHIRKPDTEIFKKAVVMAGMKGDEAIYVDDRAERVGGALKLGIKVVIFYGDTEKFKKAISDCLAVF